MKNQDRSSRGALFVLFFALLSLSVGNSMADEQSDALKAMIASKAVIKAGRAKAQICTRCHGRDGIHQLALRAGWKGSDGQFATVKLQAFRDGKVSHQVMNAVASGLKDQDIMQIAMWLDSLAAKR